MKVSLKWVNELVNIEQILEDELVNKLTLAGFEVEEIQSNKLKQTNLNIATTANRSDSLSIQGISVEISSIIDKSINVSPYWSKVNTLSKNITQGRHSNLPNTGFNQNCDIFISIIVENITNPRTPNWMTQKLINSNVSPVNNLIDFQNYILLETGYPIAIYDFKKVQSEVKNSSFRLNLETAKTNQKFLGANSKLYCLNESILLVKADDITIGVAGIIEDDKFSYSQETTSLLIEGSIFNAATIRKQSRNLGVQNTRSLQYEKSIKPTYLIEALYRLVSLLRISNPGLTCKLSTVKIKNAQTSELILLRYSKINKILGPINQSHTIDSKYLSINNIENYLKRLNFVFKYDAKTKSWEVTVPSVRTGDIKREIDLIEEIGRLHGFNNFLATLPEIRGIGFKDKSYQTRNKLTSCLLSLGFTELIHYSLTRKNLFVNNDIELINSVILDYSSLRISLLPNLIKTVQQNLKQGNNTINGFEYGHIFSTAKNSNFQEKEFISGLFGGSKVKLNWSSSETNVLWFEAKGKIEQLFNQLNLEIEWKTSTDKIDQIFHPYRKANLYLQSGVKLGNFGQINPILANKLNLVPEIYLFEFDLEVIKHQLEINQLTLYKKYSLYPKISKDISFIVHKSISFNNLKKIIYLNGTKFLTKVNLIDLYEGEFVPDEYISLCLQLTFQSKTETLQNTKIEEIIKHLKTILAKEFKATIRD